MTAVLTTGTGSSTDFEPAAEPVAGSKRRRWVPYLQLLPGGAWLLLFFVVPVGMLAQATLWDPSGNDVDGYVFTWHWQNFSDGFTSDGWKFQFSFKANFSWKLGS